MASPKDELSMIQNVSGVFRDFRRLMADALGQGPEGLDCLMTEEEALNSSGVLRITVLCPKGRDVPEGFECPHTCAPGQCEGCPGREP